MPLLGVDTSVLTGVAGIVTAVAALVVTIDAARRRRPTLRPLRGSVEAVDLPVEPVGEVAAAFVLGSQSVESHGLDIALAARSQGAEKVAHVTRELELTEVYALGSSAEATSTRGKPESEILRFTIDAEGQQRVVMPVFTSPDIVREALVRNPDWQPQSILELKGADLLRAVGEDVTVIINPWSEHEFSIPSPPRPSPPLAIEIDGEE